MANTPTNNGKSKIVLYEVGLDGSYRKELMTVAEKIEGGLTNGMPFLYKDCFYMCYGRNEHFQLVSFNVREQTKTVIVDDLKDCDIGLLKGSGDKIYYERTNHKEDSEDLWYYDIKTGETKCIQENANYYTVYDEDIYVLKDGVIRNLTEEKNVYEGVTNGIYIAVDKDYY